MTTEKRAGLEGRNGKPHVAIYRECARQELRKVTWGSRRKSATAQNPDERRRRIVRSAPANVVLDWNDPPRGGNEKTALQLLGQIYRRWYCGDEKRLPCKKPRTHSPTKEPLRSSRIPILAGVAMKSGYLARSLVHIPLQRSPCAYREHQYCQSCRLGWIIDGDLYYQRTCRVKPCGMEYTRRRLFRDVAQELTTWQSACFRKSQR